MSDCFPGISHTPCISMETEITQAKQFFFEFLERTASECEYILFISFILLVNVVESQYYTRGCALP